jgi:uncharacterized protein YgiM (DUF1202 family)
MHKGTPIPLVFAGLFGWLLLMGCSADEAAPTPGIKTEIFAVTAAPSNTPASAPAPLPTTVTPQPATQATAVITAANSSEGAMLVVTNEFVNVRKGPAVRYDYLGRLEKGAKAKVVGRSGDALWWQIQFDGAEGGTAWVINDFVQVNEAANTVPVVAVAGLPTPTTAPIVIIDIIVPTPTALVTTTLAPLTTPTLTPIPDDGCDPNNPDWRGRGQPDYTFCVRQDLEWVNADSTSEQVTLYWDVYGVQSIELRVETTSAGGKGGRRVPVPNKGQFQINKKEYTGCFKAELYITRRDGKVVGYNEKTFCA